MEKTETAKASTVDWQNLKGRWRIGEHAIFDAGRRRVDAKDQIGECGAQAADILAFLISCEGHRATHDELAQAHWKNGVVTTQGINTAINRVRKVLGADADVLKSAPRGQSAYELEAVTLLDNAAQAYGSSASEATDTGQSGRALGYTAAAIIAVIAIAGAGLGLMHIFDNREAPPPWAKSQANTSGPAPMSPPVDDDATVAEPAAPVGALSTLRYHLFSTPNITADWLSRVVSGNQSYLEPTSRAGVAYADGLRAYAESDYDRARQRIEAALQTAPDTPDYNAGLVAVEAAAGNRDTARSILGELDTANLKYPAPTRLAARLRYLTHTADTLAPDDRLVAFDDLLEQMQPVFAGNSTAVAGALAGRGHALVALERWDEAYATFQDALAITRELPYHYSTWWGRTLIAPLARTARHSGHCDAQIERLENSLQIPTLGNKYNELDAAIAIETVRCISALGRDGTASYLQALRTADRNGVLTASQRSSLAEISAKAGA